MTTNVILSMNEKVDQHILYWSILELFRDLGLVVNSDREYRVSKLHHKIKEVKDILWSKIKWCISLLKLPSEKSLVLVKVSSITLSDIKVVISLRYADE